MKKTPNNQKPSGNVKREYSQARERFEIISNYHLLDKRLTLAEKGFLTCLLILPKDWNLTTKATASYFKIAENTFIKHIQNLIKYGYIEVKKDKKNKGTYTIKDKPTIADFDIRYINDYSVKQLNYFLNDARIEQRYKNLIKKALNGAIETEEHFNKTLEEIEQETAEKTADNNELPF